MHSGTHMRYPKYRSGLISLALGVCTLAACSYTPMPRAQMAMAEAAVQHANTRATLDNAAQELQLAMDKIARARQAMNIHDYEHAALWAGQAQVDAQFAELHAQSRNRQRSQLEPPSGSCPRRAHHHDTPPARPRCAAACLGERQRYEHA